MTPKFWWYTARSTGIVAWGLAAVAVIWGLLLSTRSARGLAKPVWVLDLHRFLGFLSLVAVAAHLGALVGDNFVHFGRADLFIPWASQWKTGPVAYGIAAFWLLVIVEVSSLLKKHLSKNLWARLHLLSFAVYVLATVHYLQAGTERSNRAMLYTVSAVSAVVLYLTLLRVLAPGRRAPGRRRA